MIELLLEMAAGALALLVVLIQWFQDPRGGFLG